MPRKQTAESEKAAEFDLKHRVTGAAVLLFLGALVLPWLLGPPSEASKVEIVVDKPTAPGIEAANITVDLNNDGATENVSDVEETVYISKITPLDAKGNKALVQAANQAAASTSEVSPVLESSEQENADALAELVREQKATLESTTAASSNAEDKEKQVASARAKADSISVDQQQAKRERELQAALAAELKSQQQKVKPVDVGWVVQVGLFTEKSRAVALISELKKRGFAASSSIVDTNRGKNTGTRVWLGPFTKRVSAINEQKRLKSKAGKEGFIRVYP